MPPCGRKSSASGPNCNALRGVTIGLCMDSNPTVSAGCLPDDDYDNDLGAEYLGANGRRKLLILKDLSRFSFRSGHRTKQRNNRIDCSLVR